VTRELNQSCKVFNRTIENISLYNGGLIQNIKQYNQASHDMWQVMRASDLSEDHRNLIKGSSQTEYTACKIHPEANSILQALFKKLSGEFSESHDQILLRSLKAEFLHPITVIRHPS
jgi:hypothetical protein